MPGACAAIEQEIIEQAAEVVTMRVAGLAAGTPINQLQIVEWCSITRKQAGTVAWATVDRDGHVAVFEDFGGVSGDL